jgi:hypothetical protein
MKPEDLQQHDCLAFAYPSTDDWRDADEAVAHERRRG